jgi:hypothetical protein
MQVQARIDYDWAILHITLTHDMQHKEVAEEHSLLCLQEVQGMRA